MIFLSATTDPTQTLSERLAARPKRADARRNYDKVLTAAREAFSETGTNTSLEDIARRAEVGIGTLYRNFPNRQALLEAVYIDEVEAMAQAVSDLGDLAPWDAFERWLRRFVGYLTTKQALAQELLEYVGRDAPLFRDCKAVIYGGAEPLLHAAQASGEVRPDVEVQDISQMMMGIARIPATDPETAERILQIALDGLRYRPA